MAELSGGHFPSRPLATIVARDMARNRVEIAGPTGDRTILKPDGGAVTGPRLSGKVLPHLAGEWRLRGARGGAIDQIEGLMAIETADGATVLMKYIGRRSPYYGAEGWRLAATFEAPAESHGWLNDVVAAILVTPAGDDLVFRIEELLPAATVAFDPVITVDPLYRMTARDSVGKRHMIEGAVGRRYFSVAERGCRSEGRISSEWLEGFSWGVHRLGTVHGMLPVQIDMRAAMRTDDGATIMQHYIGVTPARQAQTDPDPARSWRTAAVFEAPAEGEHAWLNEIVALGIGWQEANEAQYAYYVFN